MNILIGATAGGLFKETKMSKLEDMLLFHDYLCCGKLVNNVDIKDWISLRSNYLDVSEAAFANSLPRNLYSHIDELIDSNVIDVWLGTSLDNQLFLAYFSQIIKLLDIDPEVVTLHQFKNIKGGRTEVQAIPLLSINEVRAPHLTYKLTAPVMAFLDEAWRVITSPEPDLLNEFVRLSVGPLPLLTRALATLIYRYPSASNGLTIWDERILKNTIKWGDPSARIIGFTIADGREGLDYANDIYLYNRLQNMARPNLNKPLLSLNVYDQPMRDTKVNITEFGEMVLKGEANPVSVNGIDDWIGGVHQDSSIGHYWVRNAETNIIEMATL